MARLLIVYGTTEGQTRNVVGRVAEVIRAHGHTADVVDAGGSQRHDLVGYDAVIVAASVHAGRHQSSVVRFARENAAALRRIPTALFSLSLSAVRRDDAHLRAAQGCVDTLLRETGWHPSVTFLTAGALRYTRYGLLKRWMLRRIARREGGDTDTSRDHEYTDWDRVRTDGLPPARHRRGARCRPGPHAVVTDGRRRRAVHRHPNAPRARTSMCAPAAR